MTDSLPVLHVVPRLLETHEVAFQLKCSQETVRRLLRAGDLVGVELTPRSWRVDPVDLQAFIDERKKGRNGNGTGNGNGNGHP